MKLLNNEKKSNIYASGIYPWNATLYTAMGCQAINSVLGLINQIIYNNNSSPVYRTSKTYDDTSSRMYIRANKNAISSSLSYGNPYF